MDDEPMEDCTVSPENSTQSSESTVEQLRKLRPWSMMMMMSITVEDYENQYWPKLESAIMELLTMTPGDYIPISFEQMYSCVYKCVCKQFSERLYHDLIRRITSHLERLCFELQIQDTSLYIEKFNFALDQYLQALGGIVPIFNYMNQFYIESKLKTDLNTELRKLFVIYVADKHINSLLPVLMEANSKPFTVSPIVMSNLMKNLYNLKPEFAQLRPHLFAKYLPSILPPCSESELNNYIEEVRQMQRDLLTHPDYIRISAHDKGFLKSNYRRPVTVWHAVALKIPVLSPLDGSKHHKLHGVATV
ncbi:hypothetical protein LSH36_814g01054 [Paralvinella palmiformis]|uniref:Cullin N-terminal domain-containing protein n=1 Tax=Paralvinella palmiformis TaxID=53620 RepID=A0AAD9MTQ2_9ANNE|nr:hypothetical protein LSH36_814g01054 [Paralvinella palmiformis]